jgi:hypothetical protein
MVTSYKTMNWQSWTDENWRTWINERLDEREGVFSSDPDELIAGYNRERSHASSYEGRELLELIQNADDAGAGYSKSNKMFVLLSPEALYIANTGIPFSPEGIKSLMVSDNSPKQLQIGLCIGYKGLGFRSVLGWAASIVISSGKLSISFSEKKAIEWLETLIQKSQKVKEKIERVRKEGLLYPISVLSSPFILGIETDTGTMNDDTLKKICELRNDGYDTVICLVFTKPEEIYEKVQRQIEGIGPEALLFLQHLQSLEIRTPKKQITWTANRNKNEVIINPDREDQQIWRLFSDSEEIPKELRRPEHPLTTKYEIKLAFSHKNVEPHSLFVYFPTEVLFPFPLFAHATFELTDNRQHLIESNINKFIAEKFAKLIADSAEKMIDPINPWDALLSVTAHGDIDPVLSKLGFEDVLHNEIMSRKLIPIRKQEFESASTVKRINGDFDDLLVGQEFRDLCLYTEDDSLKKQLDNMGVEYIQYDDLRDRLNRLSKTEFSMDKRADIIHRLIENHIIKTNYSPPELLIDDNGTIIPANTNITLPPEAEKFALPTWAPQRLLNSELTMLLRKKFGLTTARELTSRLDVFNVQEYNMAVILSSIIAETNKRAKAQPENEPNFRQEMLQAIWSLYSFQKPEEVPKFPDISVILPTRNGDFRPTNLMYFGKEYPSGQLLEGFYGPLEGPFAPSPAELKLNGGIDQIERFLRWLGIADSPRDVKKEEICEEFLSYVLDQLKYPAKFLDIIIENEDALRASYQSITVNSIDRLEDVLNTTDPMQL